MTITAIRQEGNWGEGGGGGGLELVWSGEKSEFLVAQAIVQELCESRGGRPGLSVLTSLLVYVDVKLY